MTATRHRWRFAWVLGLGFFVHTTSCEPPQESKVDGFFLSDGLRIHYVDEGSGPVVLLAHGFARDLSDWETPAKGSLRESMLRAGFRVIAWDLRGHGLSDRSHDPDLYGVEMAEDARRLLDYLGIIQAHAIGISFGGTVVNKLRELYPERVASVVLAGIGLPDDESGPYPDFVSETIESLERGEGMSPMYRFFLPHAANEEVNNVELERIEGRDPLALAAALRGSTGLRVSAERLSDNRVPVLAIIGAEDPLFADFERLVERMGRLQAVVLENEDHISMPASSEFRDRVLAFVTEAASLTGRERSVKKRRGGP